MKWDTADLHSSVSTAMEKCSCIEGRHVKFFICVMSGSSSSLVQVSCGLLVGYSLSGSICPVQAVLQLTGVDEDTCTVG